MKHLKLARNSLVSKLGSRSKKRACVRTTGRAATRTPSPLSSRSYDTLTVPRNGLRRLERAFDLPSDPLGGLLGDGDENACA